MQNPQTLPTIRLRPAEVAKLVRAELKDKFPGQKFSVRSDRGTISIDWTDGPPTKAVDDLTHKYAGQSFDGMTDMRSYTEAGHVGDLDGQQVRYIYGTDFVFTHRHISEDVSASIRSELALAIAEEAGIPVSTVLEDHQFWTAPQVYMREVDKGPWEQSLYVLTRVLAETRADRIES